MHGDAAPDDPGSRDAEGLEGQNMRNVVNLNDIGVTPESWQVPPLQRTHPAIPLAPQFNVHASMSSQLQTNEQPPLTPPFQLMDSSGPSSGSHFSSQRSSPVPSLRPPYYIPSSPDPPAHSAEGSFQHQSWSLSPNLSPITPLSGSPNITPPPEATPSSSSIQQRPSHRPSVRGRGSSAPPLGRPRTGNTARRSHMEDNVPSQTENFDNIYMANVGLLDRKKQREHELRLERYKAEALRLQYSPAAMDLEKQKMEINAQRSRELEAHQERLMSMYIRYEELQLQNPQAGPSGEVVGMLPPPPPLPILPPTPDFLLGPAGGQHMDHRLDENSLMMVGAEVCGRGYGSGEASAMDNTDAGGYDAHN
jgi:hypothetical protein